MTILQLYSHAESSLIQDGSKQQDLSHIIEKRCGLTYSNRLQLWPAEDSEQFQDYSWHKQGNTSDLIWREMEDFETNWKMEEQLDLREVN